MQLRERASPMMKLFFCFFFVTFFEHTLSAQVESFADSTAFLMVMNDVPVSNNRPTLHFSSDKKIFSRAEKNHLQLWEAKKKKKLLQMSFEKDIKAFPDNTGKNFLVIEQKIQKNYNEYTLHILSLNNSTKKTSAILEQGAEVMNGTS